MGEGRQGGGPRSRRAEARRWADTGLRLRDAMAEHHTTLVAASVAFFGFLALIPALAAVVSVYGLFISPADVEERVQSLFGALPAEARSLLAGQLRSIVDQRDGALTSSAVAAISLSLWTASSGIAHLMEAISLARGDRDERDWLVRKGEALLITVAAVLFTVVVPAGVAGLGRLADRAGPGPLAWLVAWAWVPLVLVGFALGLAVLYHRSPGRPRAGWRWVSWGSGLAALVWLAASVGLEVYLAHFGSYNKTYGSLAAVVVLLLWLYLTGLVILLGAELDVALDHTDPYH